MRRLIIFTMNFLIYGIDYNMSNKCEEILTTIFYSQSGVLKFPFFPQLSVPKHKNSSFIIIMTKKAANPSTQEAGTSECLTRLLGKRLINQLIGVALFGMNAFVPNTHILKVSKK